MKNQINKKSIIFGIIGLVLMVILVVIVLSSNKGPSNEQLQSDIIQQEIEGIIKTDEFKIIDDNKDKDTYWALVDVTYTKDDVQYNEKYRVAYLKYEDWQLTNIDEYNEELWTKKPITQPDVEKFSKLCEEWIVEDDPYGKYESFIYNEKQSNYDLEKGIAKYAFDVERHNAIEKESGEIDFIINFDNEKGKWEIEDVSYADSHKISYNIIHSWSGNVTYKNYNSLNETKEEVKLTIIEFNEDEDYYKIKGEFTLGNKNYNMTGRFSSRNYDYYSFSLKKTDENICEINGNISLDGNIRISGSIYPNKEMYFTSEIYQFNGDLVMES